MNDTSVGMLVMVAVSVIFLAVYFGTLALLIKFKIELPGWLERIMEWSGIILVNAAIGCVVIGTMGFLYSILTEQVATIPFSKIVKLEKRRLENRDLP